MPKPSPTRLRDILLGEAAGEGREGMAMVADIMLNRARHAGLSLEEVATQPHQFSAADRPDLAEFAMRQPQLVRLLAEKLISERRDPAFEPQYPGIRHYVTQALWNDRATLPRTHWLHRMQPAGTVGRHILLKESP